MNIVRGVTPTFALTFDGVDLTEADEVYVTFSDGRQALTKSGEAIDVSANRILVTLTQEETLSFPTGKVDIQVNWIVGSVRYASDIAQCSVHRQLLSRVLP